MDGTGTVRVTLVYRDILTKESCVDGHRIYQADFVVGAVFDCERKPSNHIRVNEL